MNQEEEKEEKKPQKIWDKIKRIPGKIGTLNIILLCVGAYMVYINWNMLEVYQTCGSAPESVWCALIGALLGECGICGWIKTIKEKHKSSGNPGENENGGNQDGY